LEQEDALARPITTKQLSIMMDHLKSVFLGVRHSLSEVEIEKGCLLVVTYIVRAALKM
jgi:hypothetical protein